MYVEDYIKSYNPPDCHICAKNGMRCKDKVCTLSMKELHELEDYGRLRKHYGAHGNKSNY